MNTTEAMFQDARAIDEDDWSTDRQIDAENALFASLEADGLDVGEGSKFADWCLHATSDEMIDAAHRMWAPIQGRSPWKAEDGKHYYKTAWGEIRPVVSRLADVTLIDPEGRSGVVLRDDDRRPGYVIVKLEDGTEEAMFLVGTKQVKEGA